MKSTRRTHERTYKAQEHCTFCADFIQMFFGEFFSCMWHILMIKRNQRWSQLALDNVNSVRVCLLFFSFRHFALFGVYILSIDVTNKMFKLSFSVNDLTKFVNMKIRRMEQCVLWACVYTLCHSHLFGEGRWMIFN